MPEIGQPRTAHDEIAMRIKTIESGTRRMEAEADEMERELKDKRVEVARLRIIAAEYKNIIDALK